MAASIRTDLVQSLCTLMPKMRSAVVNGTRRTAVFDVIGLVMKNTPAGSRSVWKNERALDAVRPKAIIHQFDGIGQRNLPAADDATVNQLVQALPGAKADYFRDQLKETGLRFEVDQRHPEIEESNQDSLSCSPQENQISIPGIEDACLRLATLDDGTKVMSVYDVMQYILHQSADTCRKKWNRSNTLANVRKLTTSYQFPTESLPTPVATSDVIIELIWKLPGELAESFKRQSIDIVKRYFAGDSTLVPEIARNAAAAAVDNDTREFLLGQKRKRAAIDDREDQLKLAKIDCELAKSNSELEKARTELVAAQTQNAHAHADLADAQAKTKRAQIKAYIDIYAAIGIDVLRTEDQRIHLTDMTRTITTGLVMNTLAIENGKSGETGGSTKEHVPYNETNQISFSIVCCENGLRYDANKVSKAGKLMKKWYNESDEFKKKPIKKHLQLVGGRSTEVNTYYSKHKPLMLKVCKEIFNKV